jgi:hypothetical protein
LSENHPLGNAKTLNLNVSDRAKLLNRIPQDSLENLISISQEKSGALGWNRLLAFGEQEVLKGNQEVGSAVLGFIKTSGAHGGAPLPIRQQAQKTIHILQGQWAPFEQASYSLSRLVPNALDYRVISPIIGASLVGRLVGTWALGRIAWGTGFAQFLPKFFHQGLAARFTAGMISVAAETPMYVAGNRFFLVSMTLVRRRWRRGI